MYKNSKDIAKYLEAKDNDFIDKHLNVIDDIVYAIGNKPRRVVADPYDEDRNERDTAEVKTEQEEYDIDYADERITYYVRKETLESNMYKAYEYILGCCNSAMKNRIRDSNNYKSIRNKPRALLEEISKKMYDPAQAKYQFGTVTKLISRLMTMKQGDKESLHDYTSRFKQVRDDIK